MTEPKTFSFDDIYSAAFAATRCRLLSTQQIGTRTHFIFDDADGRCSQSALDFVNNPTVLLRDYLASLREIRSIAFASRKTGEIAFPRGAK